MAETRPTVLRADQAPRPPGPPTPGMDRHEIVERGETWIGWVETARGFAGGWHHHGDRDSYIYVIKGQLTLEYGRDGGESVTARAGDVIVNPARMIHREITSPNEPAELLVVRIGTGPQNVNVDGPEG